MGNWGGLTRSHAKRMFSFMGLGSAIFVAFLLAVQVGLVYAGQPPDQTFYDFYPIMVALGAAFGFERWWAHEQGGVNPFHDK